MAIACLLHSGRVVSSSHINRLYHADWPFYSTTHQYHLSKLMSVGQGWICEGVIIAACHSGCCILARGQWGCFVHSICRQRVLWWTLAEINWGEKRWSQIIKRAKSLSVQFTWESKAPHKAPLPQHSLTHKHKEHLLDSQFKSEGEKQHL